MDTNHQQRRLATPTCSDSTWLLEITLTFQCFPSLHQVRNSLTLIMGGMHLYIPHPASTTPLFSTLLCWCSSSMKSTHARSTERGMSLQASSATSSFVLWFWAHSSARWDSGLSWGRKSGVIQARSWQPGFPKYPGKGMRESWGIRQWNFCVECSSTGHTLVANKIRLVESSHYLSKHRNLSKQPWGGSLSSAPFPRLPWAGIVCARTCYVGCPGRKRCAVHRGREVMGGCACTWQMSLLGLLWGPGSREWLPWWQEDWALLSCPGQKYA